MFTAESEPHRVEEPLPHAPQKESKISAAVHAAVYDSLVAQESAFQTVLSPESTVSEPSTDDLIFRFWQLRVDVMRDIAFDLGLITEADLDVPPHRRYFKAMEVAKQNGLLVELARQIEKHEQKT